MLSVFTGRLNRYSVSSHFCGVGLFLQRKNELVAFHLPDISLQLIGIVCYSFAKIRMPVASGGSRLSMQHNHKHSARLILEK